MIIPDFGKYKAFTGGKDGRGKKDISKEKSKSPEQQIAAVAKPRKHGKGRKK